MLIIGVTQSNVCLLALQLQETNELYSHCCADIRICLLQRCLKHDEVLLKVNKDKIGRKYVPA